MGATTTIAADAAPADRKPPAMSKLDLRAPVLLGFTVITLFFGVGVCGAAFVPIDKGVGMPGTIIVETKTKAVQHQRGGTVASVLVAEGQQVRSGDLMVTLTTRDIEEQIAALKTQADAAGRQLALARDEASTMSALYDRKLAARSRVLALERQVAEVEKELAGINARIAILEQDIARAAIRAPVSGRVLSLKVTGAGSVIQAGETIAELVPEDDRLVVEGHVQPEQIEQLKPGMPAKVWMTALSWREQKPLKGTLAWVSPDSVEDKRTGQRTFVARVELSEPRSHFAPRFNLLPGMRSHILLLTGERTLLDQLIDPLMRNLNRAFHG